ncbi:hypothetical protein SCLCIDRAFT_104190 [Scleroderma citrinum Foug A]|uniref:Uncharacterized protein n=1 Tax=Scleroderma citrinum Foug A TaxID=1036808 RepID=A0A0C3ELD4_9AGAM|nr:hypothetical protein SCLCIDRAFT_104190 [Scleroderma citrinum Foug A]
MSGQWAFNQLEIIAEDPDTHGAMFVPVVLGSNKTTVSVGTGHTEYYLLYISLGNVHNNVRRAHHDAVSILAFLAIPKTDEVHKNDAGFRRFHCQLFHSSLATILESLKPFMTKPTVALCPDRHYRCVIYGLGPYIADYPEQVLLACVVQGWCSWCTACNNDLDGLGGPRSQELREALIDVLEPQVLWDEYGIVYDVVPFTSYFPRTDIHELMAPNLLHQLIKGTFKDHLVTWIHEYLEQEHGKQHAAAIIADIDRRITAAPSFSALRQFPEGHGFKQWTGDDSKALMKVYLPAIAGHVPLGMVCALSAFLEICYLVQRSVINKETLEAITTAVDRFHHEHTIFQTTGVRAHFSLPCQHAMVHYRELIKLFGAPNGLCSSITESKHIRAVKEPWHCSNKFDALGQMLVTNQRLDKLAGARRHFTEYNMLDGPLLPVGMEAIRLDLDDDDDDGAADDHPATYVVKLASRPGMLLKNSILVY